MLEYAAGFAFGLFIFQALFAKMMAGGGYLVALKRTVLPEWLSMNSLMAGMIPTMAILMAQNPAAMEPTGLRFWGAMSVAILVGALTAYPMNVWLVARGLKHGMGTVQVLGRGGHSLDAERAAMVNDMGTAGRPAVARAAAGPQRASTAEIIFVTMVSLVALAAGVAMAGRFGALAG